MTWHTKVGSYKSRAIPAEGTCTTYSWAAWAANVRRRRVDIQAHGAREQHTLAKDAN